MTEQEREELPPSKLGTLETWEDVYEQTIENYRDHGDVGEIWFGGVNSRKTVRWMITKLSLNKENDKIIDIGCGNGMTLVEFAREGFTDLTGVDYSPKGIELARLVVDNYGFSKIKLEVCDILGNTLPQDFKVAHDKGTYDTISINQDSQTEKRQKYIENVHRILSPGGHLVLCSCNWTKEELLEHFGNHFELIDQLATDTFQFGGQVGSTVTQLMFKKK